MPNIKEKGLFLHFNGSIMKTISLMAVEFRKALILLVTGTGALQYFNTVESFDIAPVPAFESFHLLTFRQLNVSTFEVFN
jgi:hypothetical protein